ncbi:Conserved membrane hypothetical protein [Vibrio chagasii]|nr:Conserved membrane hypothetical protein [Vibrio chagasii]CAH7303410.1 conserved hypothetical protein [Vibrio chagasii]CAH7339582.1 conserved hypothetical protein [Vibrio chagasii]CAH7455897.1 conserved hypothetical protein [Vibrio chagasii]
MSNDSLIAPEVKVKAPSRDKLEPQQGHVSKIIGSGENAQNSIVYKTIAWSFLSGVIFSAIMFGYIVYKDEGDLVSSIKSIWSIFIPVITLSLGYIFGKAK